MRDRDTPFERDALTGLDGLTRVRTRMGEWSARGAGVSVMLVGLRRFDTVNLAYGAHAGDTALVEVAGRILHFAAAETDDEWQVARAGGGTFLFAATGSWTRERWHWLAETLASAISQPITNLTAEAGVRLWPSIALLQVASTCPPDKAIIALAERLETLGSESARRIGWVDGELPELGGGHAELAADLVNALDRNEIAVLFQGQHEAGSGAIVGAEALARWEHPQLGRMGAEALFAIAARAEQTVSLSRQIARRALALAAEWPRPIGLSLNVTPADLAAGTFAEELEGLVAAARIDPERITLEITEQALLAEVDRSASILTRLKSAGMKVVLDDFGAGFCNFHYLKTLPLDGLKLDRGMLDGIVDGGKDLAVFRGIVAMARALDLTVLAEGVETEAQRRVIEAEGCERYQGFLSSRPMDAEEFVECLA